MTRRTLITLLCALLTTYAHAQEASDASRRRAKRFDLFISNLLRELPNVWEKDIKAAIRGTYPGIDESLLQRIEFRLDDDPCAIQPSATRLQDGTPVVRVGLGFIRLWLYGDQARVFFFTGDRRFSDPGLWIEYMVRQRQVIADIIRTCHEDKASARRQVLQYSVAAGLGMQAKDYDEFLDNLSKDKPLVSLADQFGLGIMFILLHEAGHHLLGHVGNVGAGPQIEIEADDHAARVLRRWEHSPFIGVGAIATAIFATEAPGAPGAEASGFCRLLRLTRDDPYIEKQLGATNLGMYSRRMRQHQRALTTRLATLCGPPAG